MQPAFAKNIHALRTKHKLNQEDFANKIGVTRQTVGKWEKGEQLKPRSDEVLESIKQAFSVTEEELFSDTNGYYARLHGLTDAPAGALAMAPTKPAYAPLLGRVHAGDASEPDILDDRIPLPHEVAENHPDAYFLEVEGDCMDRVYPPGCFILVDKSMIPQDRSIAVASIDGADYIVRRLLRGSDTFTLKPESFNPEWRDIVLRDGDGHEVRFEGTVVWFQSREEMG